MKPINLSMPLENPGRYTIFRMSVIHFYRGQKTKSQNFMVSVFTFCTRKEVIQAKDLSGYSRIPRGIVVYASLVFFAFLSGLTSAGPIYNASIDPFLYGYLKQADVCGVNPQVACGPTAAVNSFAYLQNKYPNIYQNLLVPLQDKDLNNSGVVNFYDDMIATANVLAGAAYMNTGATGTTTSGFIYGKNKYIEQKVPGRTIYSAQMLPAWSLGPAIPKPSYVQDGTTPTWQFLFDELSAGEDVEIGVVGTSNHFLTLTSFHWEDKNSDGVIDQAENAYIDFVDPDTGGPGMASTWQNSLGGSLISDYGGGNVTIRSAIAESVPEPGTLGLIGLGFGLMGWWRKKGRGVEFPLYPIASNRRKLMMKCTRKLLFVEKILLHSRLPGGLFATFSAPLGKCL